MDQTLLAALAAALLSGLGGLLVPSLIARVPEPEPKAVDESGDEEAAADGASDEPPKMLYADIAARPGLAWRSAAVSAACAALLAGATGADWSLLWLVPLTPVAVALVVAVGLATDERDALVRALLGMVVARSFFWVLWFVRSAGMGFGDVRLAAPVGLVLGWVGWGALAIGIWIAFIAFAVPALALAVVRRDRTLLKKSFPFGPFMVIGALVGLAWGTALAGRIWG